MTVLCKEPARFNALKRRLDPITRKAQTEALRRLERNGLVNRRVIASSPVAVEYSITALRRKLKEPYLVLVTWESTHGENLKRLCSHTTSKSTAETYVANRQTIKNPLFTGY
ncbi:helix-turn-helix domain-containing protein [Caballeronia sp. GAWG1-1]|uniref:winged helix-turn-helix transcriptional regulator n=1 Tax=Caballeronia sp. GAWG1-1 TaxID=2921742 RepID=UPI00253F80E3|nr:helix-turn-helix domain-containing protein [Caballeronia sp. GAWG1-1]